MSKLRGQLIYILRASYITLGVINGVCQYRATQVEELYMITSKRKRADNATHRIILIVIVVFAILLVVGGSLQTCSQSDKAVEEGLPSWAKQEKIQTWTQEVIDDFNARDYEAIASRYADGSVTAEQLSENLSTTQDELGAYTGSGTTQYLNGTSNGRSYVTDITQATFEHGEGEFRISFFDDGSLAAFYFLRS